MQFFSPCPSSAAKRESEIRFAKDWCFAGAWLKTVVKRRQFCDRVVFSNMVLSRWYKICAHLALVFFKKVLVPFWLFCCSNTVVDFAFGSFISWYCARFRGRIRSFGLKAEDVISVFGEDAPWALRRISRAHLNALLARPSHLTPATRQKPFQGLVRKVYLWHLCRDHVICPWVF